jgi:tRNA pseudouridine32 synthase / 23S rRNA pseudouridine746 synthase
MCFPFLFSAYESILPIPFLPLNTPVTAPNSFFISFGQSIDAFDVPDHFTQHSEDGPHPLCLLASKELQHHLETQDDWKHNFGLSQNDDGFVIGKMFGVLLVQTAENKVGYLAAFSGKLAGSNQHAHFVPPVFDGLQDHGFLNKGMAAITHINKEIDALELLKQNDHVAEILLLKTARKKLSISLQHELFDHYRFLNQAGEEKNIRALFHEANYKNPPSGAGECAAPKLLQYAFQHQMKPLALAEFWWGASPKSDFWQHGQFYPCCKEKCGPILVHMLKGINA